MTTGQIADFLAEGMTDSPYKKQLAKRVLQRWVQKQIREGKIKVQPPPDDGRKHHHHLVSIVEIQKVLNEVPQSFWDDIWIRYTAKFLRIRKRWAKKRYYQR